MALNGAQTVTNGLRNMDQKAIKMKVERLREKEEEKRREREKAQREKEEMEKGKEKVTHQLPSIVSNDSSLQIEGFSSNGKTKQDETTSQKVPLLKIGEFQADLDTGERIPTETSSARKKKKKKKKKRNYEVEEPAAEVV